MSKLTQAKLALALVAAIIWGAGYVQRNDALTWIGVGILAVAVLLRFVKPRG